MVGLAPLTATGAAVAASGGPRGAHASSEVFPVERSGGQGSISSVIPPHADLFLPKSCPH